MPEADLELSRRAWADARAAAAAARTTLVRAKEQQKRLARRLASNARVGDEQERERLTAARRDAVAAVRKAAAADAAAQRTLLEATKTFAAFTDPTSAVAKLPDDTPFALFPLRLETRYLTRSSPEGRPARFLCVRVFPDDALIDAFQPEISESEFESLRLYWADASSAGDDENARRAAWSELAKRHGAGRAHWLLEQVTPSASGELPDPETLSLSQADWTRPARAWLLPERLVLLGFRAGNEVVRVVGQPVPAEVQVGPDPNAPEDQQIHAEGADLALPDQLAWMVDFDAALAKGLGFAVPLDSLGGSPDLDLLLVLGVRIGSDPQRGAEELSSLIAAHQNSRKGLALLPQGRPTNNTDTSNAGYTWWEDPAASYRHFFETDPADDPSSWKSRKDGAWLAGVLGVDRAVLRPSPNYYGSDQAEARAMNAALWPATGGYYMEQMLEPVFTETTVTATRGFFHRFVLGRGTVPLVRIGRQPYGILPTTVWSRLGFWSDESYARLAARAGLPNAKYLDSLHALTERVATLWRTFSADVSHVGAGGESPHQTLLDIVGLHPTSAELYQRYSQSFTQYYDLLGFATEPVSGPVAREAARYVQAGLAALANLGFTASDGELPRLLACIFLKQPNLLKGDLVQTSVSDSAPLAVTREDGLNYIAWLEVAARTSHEALRRQEGFAGAPPTALLYLLLQHALDLGYVDTALSLRRSVLALPDAVSRSERREPEFIDVATQGGGKSRWDVLYRPEPAITGDATRNLGDLLVSLPASSRPFQEEQLAALDVLKKASSGALERALLEHIDCLSYRFDAWRAGLQAVQLSYMRRETDDGFEKGGILLGAYGWVQDLKPKPAAPDPVALDGDLAGIFTGPGEPSLAHDRGNFGFIHAPSLDHAVTAAILRNGHLANATPDARDLFAVELTSKRVRQAERVLEGIRNGQSLGALLGYQLERALHDVPNLFLDRVVQALRAVFPLAGNRNRLTRVAPVQKIERVEARNVVDGEALLDHLETSGVSTYPYALSGLPPLSELTGPGLPSAAEIGAIIDDRINGLRVTADAVADLGVAEGVYQLVRSNYDRAAGVADALSKGAHPPVFEVCSTPRRGRTLTHRIVLHLAGGVAPAAGGTRPRERGEPALAQWLAQLLPAPASIFARVSWREAGAPAGTLTPSMAALGLSATDLFYLLEAGKERELAAFDELLLDFAEQSATPPSHAATYELEYKPAGVSGLTLFELGPLVRALREVVLGARPLRPSDLSRPSEATRDEDATLVARIDKAQAVLALFSLRLPPVSAFIGVLEAAIGDGIPEETARDAARDNIDSWLTAYGSMARPLPAFGLPAGGLTAGIEGRRPRLTALHDALDALIARWQRKQREYDALLQAYAALPGAATLAERVAVLVRAARLVSTAIIEPNRPLTELETAVSDLRGAFDDGLASLTTLRAGARKVGATLQALTAFVPTYDALDLTPLDLAPLRASVRALADDLLRRARALLTDLSTRKAAATDALAAAGAATGEKAHAAALEAARALLGESFVLLPEITLSAQRRAEWALVWAERSTLLDHLKSGPEATPYPLDDWLQGVARVRERVRPLELAIPLGTALGSATTPSLVPLQFPYRPADDWLGLRFPATAPDGSPFVLTEDKLLYTATFGPAAELDPADATKTYAGLLLDEWIETIPSDTATTGLAFHFDRPNSEAPQAILLVTPPVQRGAWNFADLVDSLRETLEMARFRAVEPAMLDRSALGPLVPATLSAVTMLPVTAMLNFAFNSGLAARLEAES